MNPYVVNQAGFSSREEIRGSFSVYDRAVLCPKPRRLGFHCTDQPVRSLRLHISQLEIHDCRQASEVVDIIIKGGSTGDQLVVASSPPFFTGSPPSRVANPQIHDARFIDEDVGSLATEEEGVAFTSARKTAGRLRGSFGNNPAVRIEGFDSGNCGISAPA